MDERELSILDIGGYPEIYADEVAEIQHLSCGNRRVVLCAWHRVDGVYRRMVVGAIIRPVSSFALSIPKFLDAMSLVAPVGVLGLQ